MPEYVVVDQIAVGVPDPKVEGSVNHVHYVRGQTVELTKEVGDDYVADGAVRPVTPPEAPGNLSDEEEGQRLLAVSASQTPAERSNEDKSGQAETSSSGSSKSSKG